jgi:hypothetical protein
MRERERENKERIERENRERMEREGGRERRSSQVPRCLQRDSFYIAGFVSKQKFPRENWKRRKSLSNVIQWEV